MSFNLARLNHIFIPTTRSGRDRLRRTWAGSVGRPIAHLYFALTDEGRATFVFALVAGFAGLDLNNSNNHLLWCALFAPLVVGYGLRLFFPMRGVRMEVRGPDRVAVHRTAEIELTLINDSDRDYLNVRIEGPLLPWDGRWTTPRPAVPELRAGERRTIRIGVRFRQRGLHELDAFRAAPVCPLGLTTGRGVEGVGAPFHVVPSLENIVSLQLPAVHSYQRGGVALASKTGESVELLGLRPYRRGDRIRDLHSRSWARVGVPVVREYQQEYFSRVGVILDTESTRLDERQLEAAVSLTAGVVARLTRGEALIDVLVTDGEIHPLTLGRGLGHLEQAIDHLSTVELRRPVPEGRGRRRALWRARIEARPVIELESTDRILERLAPYLDRLSCVVLVSISWGDRQRAMVDGVGARGITCRAVTVAGGHDDSISADRVVIDPAVILRGGEVHL
ncbi:MAG: DUF58 domain-containing protein [Planctomycetes bacterium]|nr:DUF58 domain-containing protein [Planctomycetota bacterium]